jgi:hypothetical protein
VEIDYDRVYRSLINSNGRGDLIMKKLTTILLAILALAIAGGSTMTWVF